jgi:hypothetical protein
MPTTSRSHFSALLVLGALLGSSPALAQEEVGKRERKKIAIDWAKAETKNYAIEYEKAIPASTVTSIGNELERALEQYVLVFKYKPENKLKAKFLDSLNTYEQEGGRPGSAAHFDPGSEYLVLQQLPFFQLVPTTYHEACHQYLHFYVGRGTPIPLWFNEGMASYFEQMQETRGPKKKLDHKLIDNRQLRMIQQKIITRTALPLAKLIAAGHEEFHPADDKQKEGLYYTQSFSMIYFLMQGMGGKPAFQFAEELKKTKSVDAANEKIFGKELKNLKSVEGKWKQYIAGVQIVEPPPRQ